MTVPFRVGDDPLDVLKSLKARTTGQPYEKNGHQVVDTSPLDNSGHVPTHRLDQATNKLPNESWTGYEDRVLGRRSFSPDTAQVSSLSALEPDVADSTRSLMNAAASAGVHLSPVETRRSQERQEMLFQKGRTAPGGVATWTLTSDHTPGRAVDFSGDPSAFSWLQKNAPTHGFSVMGSMDPGHVSMPQQSSRPNFSDVRGGSSTAAVSQIEPGNVDLAHRPRVKNPDGTTSTVRSMSFGEDGREILVPTVSDDGRILSDNDAIDTYHRTGKFLGKFPSVAQADSAASAIHEQQAAMIASDDPLEQLKAMRRPAPAAHNIHAEYASGNLAKRMQRENENDAEAAADGEPTSTLGAFGHSLAATGANIAQGIPGMEAVEAGARSGVRTLAHKVGLPVDAEGYREALGDIRGETAKIPTALRVGEKIAGAAPLAGVLPGSPATSGAIIGGADQALSADPDESVGGRVARTAAGAVGGALVGKATDAAITGARVMLPKALGGAENPASLLIRKQAERAASAKKLYGAALQEGRNNGTSTPEIRQFLSEPDIQEIVTELQQTRPFANTPSDAPEMLDAVYKTLSDRAGVVKKGLQAVKPNRPNIGRFTGQDIKAAQTQGLDAMSGTPGNSPMPSYARAVEDFAQRSREMEAIKQGYGALRSSLSHNLPTENNLTRKTPEAFAEWASKAPPEQVTAARQGIVGGAKMAAGKSLTMNPLRGFGVPKAAGALTDASKLLRDASMPEQQWIEALQNLGLLTAGNATTP